MTKSAIRSKKLRIDHKIPNTTITITIITIIAITDFINDRPPNINV